MCVYIGMYLYIPKELEVSSDSFMDYFHLYDVKVIL